MMLRFFATATLVALGATAAGLAYAQHGKAPTGAAAGGGQHGASGAAPAHAAPPTTACTPASVGPQSPRDITSKAGANANATFALASKPGPNMRLCNDGVPDETAVHPVLGECVLASETSPLTQINSIRSIQTAISGEFQ